MDNPESGQSNTLILTDPETNQSYSLYLNKEDYDRALEDDGYAASLLHHVTQSAERTVREETETQDSVLLLNTESESQESKWTYDATNALIASMHNYMEDFGHPKKRKLIFSNLSNDLLSQGFAYSEQSCRNKYKSLERTYKSNKDKNLKSGRGASRFFFYDKMEELLGNKPANKNDHTLESSVPSPLSLDTNSNSTLSETPPLLSPNPDESVKRGIKRKSEKETEKQKRHEERMNIEKEKLQVEKDKIRILQQLLDKLN
ncbi:hypothetical protein RN001_002676 [Aquatica leii]|uniref:Myb/SANT-like DNA-binding domain-containing protein n=1 Tax=Aquatica leii TaxID=1421715 RepID=A0AAN7PDU4_9COLE|nr:hypothetical protein RN001_002676 [Aquatica leii]